MSARTATVLSSSGSEGWIYRCRSDRESFGSGQGTVSDNIYPPKLKLTESASRGFVGLFPARSRLSPGGGPLRRGRHSCSSPLQGCGLSCRKGSLPKGAAPARSNGDEASREGNPRPEGPSYRAEPSHGQCTKRKMSARRHFGERWLATTFVIERRVR